MELIESALKGIDMGVLDTVTFLDGKLTLRQVVIIGVGVLAFLLILRFLKGVIRKVLLVVSIVVTLVHFGVVSPTQVADIEKMVAEKGVKAYESYAKTSENIKIEGDKILICVGGQWINISEVTTFDLAGEGNARIGVGGEVYETQDTNIIKLLQLFLPKGDKVGMVDKLKAVARR